MEKSKSIISWGQLFIIFGTVCLFLFAFVSSAKYEKPKEIVYLDSYELRNGEITRYYGCETIVEIPSSYSLGPTKNFSGSITFNYEWEAFDFLNEHYATGAEGYYDFYSELMVHEYPWVYNYSIDKPTFIEGDDFQIKGIGDSAFKGNENIEKVIIPSSIESIANFAFQHCYYLTEVEFNEGLTFIGDSSFWGTSVTKLELPKTLETIYPYAFFSCHKLETVIIPENVETVTLGTFNDCTSLKTVKILSKYQVDAWHTEAYQTFSRCTSLETIYVPAEHLNYYQNTSPWSLYRNKYKTL